MTDPFILSVYHKGKEIPLTAQLLLQGYSHKFKVLVNGTDVYFEPDEEGLYRVVMMPGQSEKELSSIDRDLLQLIKQKLTEILQ